jgi:hypothetical protein
MAKYSSMGCSIVRLSSYSVHPDSVTGSDFSMIWSMPVRYGKVFWIDAGAHEIQSLGDS